ncbi:unnamed protein product [Amoebophrya sp. A25]|nr:unnamed protein product [Amoebophrya sp. A25]|eukprot:GSA25T00015577001.1
MGGRRKAAPKDKVQKGGKKAAPASCLIAVDQATICCFRCGKADRPDRLLRCGGCEETFHPDCAWPKVPKESIESFRPYWRCEVCGPSRKKCQRFCNKCGEECDLEEGVGKSKSSRLRTPGSASRYVQPNFTCKSCNGVFHGRCGLSSGRVASANGEECQACKWRKGTLLKAWFPKIIERPGSKHYQVCIFGLPEKGCPVETAPVVKIDRQKSSGPNGLFVVTSNGECYILKTLSTDVGYFNEVPNPNACKLFFTPEFPAKWWDKSRKVNAYIANEHLKPFDENLSGSLSAVKFAPLTNKGVSLPERESICDVCFVTRTELEQFDRAEETSASSGSFSSALYPPYFPVKNPSEPGVNKVDIKLPAPGSETDPASFFLDRHAGLVVAISNGEEGSTASTKKKDEHKTTSSSSTKTVDGKKSSSSTSTTIAAPNTIEEQRTKKERRCGTDFRAGPPAGARFSVYFQEGWIPVEVTTLAQNAGRREIHLNSVLAFEHAAAIDAGDLADSGDDDRLALDFTWRQSRARWWEEKVEDRPPLHGPSTSSPSKEKSREVAAWDATLDASGVYHRGLRWTSSGVTERMVEQNFLRWLKFWPDEQLRGKDLIQERSDEAKALTRIRQMMFPFNYRTWARWSAAGRIRSVAAAPKLHMIQASSLTSRKDEQGPHSVLHDLQGSSTSGGGVAVEGEQVGNQNHELVSVDKASNMGLVNMVLEAVSNRKVLWHAKMDEILTANDRLTGMDESHWQDMLEHLSSVAKQRVTANDCRSRWRALAALQEEKKYARRVTQDVEIEDAVMGDQSAAGTDEAQALAREGKEIRMMGDCPTRMTRAREYTRRVQKEVNKKNNDLFEGLISFPQQASTSGAVDVCLPDHGSQAASQNNGDQSKTSANNSTVPLAFPVIIPQSSAMQQASSPVVPHSVDGSSTNRKRPPQLQMADADGDQDAGEDTKNRKKVRFNAELAKRNERTISEDHEDDTKLLSSCHQGGAAASCSSWQGAGSAVANGSNTSRSRKITYTLDHQEDLAADLAMGSKNVPPVVKVPPVLVVGVSSSMVVAPLPPSTTQQDDLGQKQAQRQPMQLLKTPACRSSAKAKASSKRSVKGVKRQRLDSSCIIFDDESEGDDADVAALVTMSRPVVFSTTAVSGGKKVAASSSSSSTSLAKKNPPPIGTKKALAPLEKEQDLRVGSSSPSGFILDANILGGNSSSSEEKSKSCAPGNRAGAFSGKSSAAAGGKRVAKQGVLASEAVGNQPVPAPKAVAKQPHDATSAAVEQAPVDARRAGARQPVLVNTAAAKQPVGATTAAAAKQPLDVKMDGAMEMPPATPNTPGDPGDTVGSGLKPTKKTSLIPPSASNSALGMAPASQSCSQDYKTPRGPSNAYGSQASTPGLAASQPDSIGKIIAARLKNPDRGMMPIEASAVKRPVGRQVGGNRASSSPETPEDVGSRNDKFQHDLLKVQNRGNPRGGRGAAGGGAIAASSNSINQSRPIGLGVDNETRVLLQTAAEAGRKAREREIRQHDANSDEEGMAPEEEEDDDEDEAGGKW